MFKIARATSSESYKIAADLCERIRSESPEYWPNGLDPSLFDGGLYLVRKSASLEPVGFVGWQERWETEKNAFLKTGYYSIGIAPEYRNNGFAKEAVAKLIAMKSASVDRVRALIVDKNKPSQELAKSLGVEMQIKRAHMSPGGMAALGGISPIFAGIGGAAGSGDFSDGARIGGRSMLEGVLGLLAGAAVGSRLGRNAGTRAFQKITQGGRASSNGVSGPLTRIAPAGQEGNVRLLHGRLRHGAGDIGTLLGGSAGLILGGAHGAHEATENYNDRNKMGLRKVIDALRAHS